MFSFLSLMFASAVVFASEYALLNFSNKEDAEEVICSSIMAFFIIIITIYIALVVGKTTEKEKPHCLACKAEITEQYNYCPECGYQVKFSDK